PLSFAQERLWFLDRMEPGRGVYNVFLGRRLRGALDAAALERALAAIVRRHDSLRTTFAEADGVPVQVIAPFTGFTLPVEDLSVPDPAEREAAVERRAAEEAGRPFDLAAGPLFRATLLRMADDDHALLLCMHHVVTDGWSVGVLLREMAAGYAAGGAPPLPPLPVQYADYAVWQREQLAGEALDAQLAWWKERLAGAPALLELPTDRPRPAVQGFDGATEPVELPAELLEKLRALGRAEGATLFMVLLSTFKLLLSLYTSSDDVVVGSPVAGRTRGEVEALVGFFVNTLVLRTDLSGDPGFRETLRRVRKTTLGAYERQDVPFEKLVAELQPGRSLSHSPVVQVIFTAQDGAASAPALPGLAAASLDPGVEPAKFDLSLGLAATPRGLRGAVTYRTDLFDAGTVRRLVQHLGRVLEQVAADPALPLSCLELLGPDERRVVLGAWGGSDAAYAAERRVHRRVAGHAACAPHAPAVVDGARTLTFGELDARAAALARRLRARGVGPDVPVAVCLERGAALVVAMLGVMKAGGAYVALDPAYPADRLGHMLADSGVSVLLTHESVRGRLPARAGVEALCVG
ncbi:MAG TPA: condensation domain-containing protein, partial [Longimicrobiaceae bacterium]|nr:condensation domain-containing protein [Longimicrobiaceae bacterium]